MLALKRCLSIARHIVLAASNSCGDCRVVKRRKARDIVYTASRSSANRESNAPAASFRWLCSAGRSPIAPLPTLSSPRASTASHTAEHVLVSSGPADLTDEAADFIREGEEGEPALDPTSGAVRVRQGETGPIGSGAGGSTSTKGNFMEADRTRASCETPDPDKDRVVIRGHASKITSKPASSTETHDASLNSDKLGNAPGGEWSTLKVKRSWPSRPKVISCEQ